MEDLVVSVLTTSYPRNERDDAGIFVRRLVNALGKVGVKGEVVVPHDKEEPKLEEQGAFHVRRFSYGIFKRGALAFGAGIVPNLKRNASLLLQVPNFLLSFTCTTFISSNKANLIHGNWLVSAIPGAIVSWFNNKPLVLTARGEDVRLLKKQGIGFILKLFIRRAVKIIAVSDGIKEDLKHSLPTLSDRIITIPNGVDLPNFDQKNIEDFASKHKLSLFTKYLVSVGSIIPRKQTERIIEALSSPYLDSYHLLLCGRVSDFDYHSGLVDLVNQRALNARVHFLGSVAPDEIQIINQMSFAFISASSFEGRPNAVLEALAASKIVIASDIKAHRDLIRSGENGFIFRETSEIGEIIHRIAESLDHKKKIEAAALESIKDYTWEECAKSYKRVFEEIVVGRV